MKISLFPALALLAFPHAAGAAPQMSESAAEFFTSADFDGDGRLDAVIIDRAAGVIRLGYQTAPETWTWVPSRPAGAAPVAAACLGRLLAGGQGIFINELHYDNAGTDIEEGVEIAGPAGTNLGPYDLVFYNGTGGGLSGATRILSGIIPNAGDGYGAVWFARAAIENGSPDGVALVLRATGQVVQFLSWEGTFTATAGPALGKTSTDIGVSETNIGASHLSLQLSGAGSRYSQFVWSGPAPSTHGLPNTDQTLGGAVNAPLIAVTSQPANRVLIHRADNPALPAVPVSLFGLIGPDALAPVPEAAGGPEHLLAGSAIDPASAPGALAGLEGSGTVLFRAAQNAVLSRGQPLLLKTGSVPVGAFLAQLPGSVEFRVYGIPAGPPALASYPVPTGSHYASGMFDAASPLAQLLLWVPGTPTLLVRPVEEPAAGAFVLGAETAYTMSGDIGQVIVLDDPDGPRLLMIFDGGASAGVFTFDGLTAPVAVTTLTAGASAGFRAAVVSGGGGFVLAAGSTASARSEMFRPYRREAGGGYMPLASASLPSVTTNSGRANVLLFSDPPFVTENVRPIAALHAGDWTRSVAIGGGGAVSAVGELFAGSTAGLDDPAVYALGTVAGADEVLANQFEPWLSVASLRAVYDTPELEPSIAPMPGRFDSAQLLSFSAPPGVSVSYRLGSAPWQTWIAGSTVWMTADTTVLFYGTGGAPSRKSSLRTADYTFAHDGPWLDSDRDGIPDFVETGMGLDPTLGHDTDGDGAGDDAELLAGTDANNPAVKPAPGALRPGDTGITLTATLRSWTSGAPDPALVPAAPTRIDALDIAAARFATRETAALSDSAGFQNFSVPADTRFISLTSPASYARTGGGPASHAAQMIAIVPPVPPPAVTVIAYVPAGGTMAAEALAWIEALRTAEAALVPRAVAATLSPVDSLSAMLIERRVDEILISRGADAAVRLSLFSTGSSDAGARRVSVQDLAALELPGPANEPAWRLGLLHSVISGAVLDTPGSAGMQTLRLMAADIYSQFEAVWVPPSEADPDGTTAAFPAPLDVLRSFARGETLPAGYLAMTTLTPSQIADAAAAVAAILALPAPRPETSVTLTARADSFQPGCTVFDNGVITVALLDRAGRPWKFRGSIGLPAGTLVSIHGFTDVTPPGGCADTALEVLSASVLTLPGGPVTDDDADGMGDEWELVFFGSLSQTPGADHDGDGATNAAEFAAGTDPAGGIAPPLFPNLPPLPVPDPAIMLAADGLVELTWECTEECRRTLLYTLECDANLDGSWLQISSSPEFLPDGRMRYTIEPRVPGRCFFRLRVTKP